MDGKNNEGEWFSLQQKRDNLFLITEPHFCEGNRCNIWLLKGGHTDLIIDCGLGVRNLRTFLEDQSLLDPVDKSGGRPCVVVCTHVHFDHSGGAVDFDNVYIHADEREALLQANSLHTLNWVKREHFNKKPFAEFRAAEYRVKQTKCDALTDGEKLVIGDLEHVEIMHLPGHSSGSIALYYPAGQALFVGDIVYECGYGTGFLDWLPSSSVNQYLQSCARLNSFIETTPVKDIYPGHFNILTPNRTQELLLQYVEYKKNILSRGFAKCLRLLSTLYFKFR